MDLMAAILNRKSIRSYQGKQVPEDALNKILEAGRRAPSWTNSQTWRFIIVRDNATKEKLAQTALSAGNRGFEALKQAPVALVVCAELNKSGCRDGKPLTNKEGYWYMFDAGITMQNMVLAAWAEGLGTCYLGGFDADAVDKILGIPDGYAIVAMTPLGYPAEEPAAKPRKELSEIVMQEKFGSSS